MVGSMRTFVMDGRTNGQTDGDGQTSLISGDTCACLIKSSLLVYDSLFYWAFYKNSDFCKIHLKCLEFPIALSHCTFIQIKRPSTRYRS